MSNLGGRERTEQKKEQMDQIKADPKNAHMFVCDLQALKVGAQCCERNSTQHTHCPASVLLPARSLPFPRVTYCRVQEASLKCQTQISAQKLDCSEHIFAYRECLKAMAKAQKDERDKVFWGKK